MKKARSQKLKKFNKVLSVLLAAAMVAGSVPDVSLVAHATEAETEAELDIQDSENQDFEESGSDVQDNENAADADTGAEAEEQTGSSEAEELEADESIQPAAENPDTDNQDTENNADNNTDSKAADTNANENTAGEEAEGEDGKAPEEGNDNSDAAAFSATVTFTKDGDAEGIGAITYDGTSGGTGCVTEVTFDSGASSKDVTVENATAEATNFVLNFKVAAGTDENYDIVVTNGTTQVTPKGEVYTVTVTGNTTITVKAVPKQFDFELVDADGLLSGSISGVVTDEWDYDHVTYKTNVSFTVNDSENCKVQTVVVTVDGTEITGENLIAPEGDGVVKGTYTLKGVAITGKVVVTITGEKNERSVVVADGSSENATIQVNDVDIDENTKATFGTDFVFTVVAKEAAEGESAHRVDKVTVMANGAEVAYKFAATNPSAPFDAAGTYTIAGKDITADLTIKVETVAMETVTFSNEENISGITYAEGGDEIPSKIEKEVTDAKTENVGNGYALYIQVAETKGNEVTVSYAETKEPTAPEAEETMALLVDSETTEVTSADGVKVEGNINTYKIVVEKPVTVTFTQKVTDKKNVLNVVKDNSNNYKKVELSIDGGTTYDEIAKNQKTVEIPKNTEVKVRVTTKDRYTVMSEFVVTAEGGSSRTIEGALVENEEGKDENGDKYGMCQAIYSFRVSDRDREISLKAVPSYEVQFEVAEDALEASGLKYNDKNSFDATATTHAKEKLYVAKGKKIYVEVTPKADTTVTVAQDDTALTPVEDTENVYEITVNADTKIEVTGETDQAVTVDFIGGTAKFDTKADGEFKTELATGTPSTDKYPIGTKLYVQFTPTAGIDPYKDAVIKEATQDGVNLTEVSYDKKTGIRVYEITVKKDTDIQINAYAVGATVDVTLKFASDVSEGATAKITLTADGKPVEITNAETDGKKVPLPAGENFTFTVDPGNKAAEGDTAAQQYVVSKVNDGAGDLTATSTSGYSKTYTYKPTAAATIIVTTAEEATVAFEYKEGTTDGVEKILWTTKSNPTKESDYTNNATIGTPLTGLAKGETVSFVVVPKAGYKIKSAEGAAGSSNIFATPYTVELSGAKTINITTEAAYDVTFATSDAKINPVVKYITVLKDGSAGSEQTLSDTKLSDLAAETTVYFKIALPDGTTTSNIANVTINGTEATPIAADTTDEAEKAYAGYYKIAAISADAAVVANLDTVNSVTFNVANATGVSVYDANAEEGAEAVTSKVIKAGESYSFDLKITQEDDPTSAEENAKIDTVKLRSVTFEYKDARGYSKKEDLGIAGTGYTITPKAGCSDFSVVIKADAYKDGKVTVTADESLVEGKYAFISAELTKDPIDPTKVTTLTLGDTGNTIEKAEDKTLYMQLKTKNPLYKIKSVQLVKTVDGKPVKSDVTVADEANGIYSVTFPSYVKAGDLDLTIEVKTVLDSTSDKLAKINFGANVAEADSDDADAAQALVAVTGVSGVTGYTTGGVWLTDSATAKFTVNAVPGYEVVSIAVNGKNVEITDSELEGINNYKTPSTKEFELKDLVKTEEGTTTYPGATIVIETRAAKAKVSSVTIRSKKTPDITFIADGEERTSSYEYGIEDDETELSFDVVARGAYEPTVKIINGRNEKELTADSSAPNGNNKTIYTYHVLTGALTSGDSIVIDGEEVNKNLTIEYNKADIAKVEVYVNGSEDAEELDEKIFADNIATEVFYIKKTNQATVYVTVKDGNELICEGFEQTENPNVYKCYIKSVEEDITKKLETQKSVSFTLSDGTDVLEPNSNDVYAVATGVTYVLTGKLGTDDITFTAAELTGVSLKDEEKPVVSEDGKSITLVLPATAGGKTKLTFKATYQTGDEATADVTYKMSAAKAITSVSFDKKYKEGKADQTMITEAAYKLTLKGGNDYTLLDAVADGDAGIIADTWIDPKTKSLVVVTSEKEGTQKVNICLKGVMENEQPKVMASLDITSVKPALAVKDMKLTSALHNGFVLNVSVDSKLSEVFAEDDVKLAYKTVVTPPATSKYVFAKDNTYYNIKTTKTAKEDIKVVFGVKDGVEEPASYGIKTTLALVRVNDKGEVVKELCAGTETKDGTFETKKDYYEDTLKLTKKTGTVYSGQSEVVVATAKFSKNATYQVLGTATVYDASGKEVSRIHAKIEDGNVVVSVPSIYTNYVAKGSYTIKVAPYAEDPTNKKTDIKLYAAPASIKFTVANGINRITLNPASDSIYQQKGKDASYKMNVVLNGGYKDYTPAKKNLTYDIVKAAFDEDGNEVWVPDTEMAKLVTVKNGTIKVSKNFVCKADPIDNQFNVRIKANDFADNKTARVVTYTVSNEQLELGNVYLARKSEDESVYNVISGTEFTTDMIDGAEIIVTKSGVTAGRAYYTEEDLISSNNYTVKAPAGMSFYYDGTLNANHKIANKLTLNVTAADCAKGKKAALNFKTVYNTASAITVATVDSSSNGILGYVEKDSVTHYSAATADDTIQIYVLVPDQNGNMMPMNRAATYNYTVSAAGGKILSDVKKAKYTGRYNVLPNKAETVITVKNGKTPSKFTFVNDAYVKAKAPSVKVVNANLLSGKNAYQYYELQITNNTYKYAYITYDAADKAKADNNDKDLRDYTDFYSNVNTIIDLRDSKGDAQRSKVIVMSTNDSLVAGTYKFNVTFGNKLDESNLDIPELIPLTSPAKYSVKVGKISNFKPTASYTYNPAVGQIYLTGKPVGAAYYTDKIKNANVAGQPNEFTKYFAMEDSRLYINEAVDASGKGLGRPWTLDELNAYAALNKNNLTGYAEYYNYATGTREWAKITIKVKASAYKAQDITTYAGTESAQGITSIKNPWSGINVGYIAATGEGIAFKDVVYNASTGKIALETTTVPAPGKYDVTLYVVDRYAAAYDIVNKETTAANKNAKAVELGTPVTLKFTVLDPVKKGKVKLDKTYQKFTFDEHDYVGPELNGVSASWHRDIQLTSVNNVAFAGVAKAESAAAYDFLDAKLLESPESTPTKKVYSNRVDITLNKAAFKAAADADKKLYGKKITLELMVSFAQGGADADEKIKVQITLPKSVEEYATSLAALKSGGKTKLLSLTDIGNSTSVNEAKIWEALDSLVSLESGVKWTVKPPVYEWATKEKTGYYIVDVEVFNSDKGKETDEKYTISDVRWTIGTTNKQQTLYEAYQAVEDEIGVQTDYEENVAEIKASTTASEIKANALAAAKRVVTNPDIQVRYAWNGFQVEGNSVSGTILLSRSIWSRETVTFNYTIPGADTMETARTKIETAVKTNAVTNLRGVDSAEKLLAVVNAAYDNPEITAVVSDFKLEEADKPAEGKNGKFSAVITLSKAGERSRTIEIVDGVLPGKDTAATVKANVEKAINDKFGDLKDSEKQALTEALVLNWATTANDFSDYTLSWTTFEDANKKGFNVTEAASYTKEGKIEISIDIKKADATTAAATAVATLTVPKLDVTIDQAKAAVEAYKFNDAENQTLQVTNSTTDAQITKALQDLVPAEKFGIAFVTDKDGKTPQEGTTKGSIKGTVTISDKKSTDKVVFSLTVEIPVPSTTN